MAGNKNISLSDDVILLDLTRGHNTYGYDLGKMEVRVRRVFAKETFVTDHGYVISKGLKGGYVQNENNIQENGWVADNAVVLGEAKIFGIAEGYAMVQDKSKVYGKASDECSVRGNTLICKDARVTGNCIIQGDVQLTEKVEISGIAHVYGRIRLAGDLCIRHNITFDNIVAGGPRLKMDLDSNPDCLNLNHC